MFRRCMLLVAAMVVSLCASAQFQEGKGYLGASLTGLDLHYNGQDGFNVGIEGKAGYFPWDNIMVLASFDAVHDGSKTVADHITVGVGGRYYITQNGLYLGAGVKLLHANHSYNDLMPGAEVGYAFFINRSVTIEPALYYDQSFKKSDYSTVGLKVGLGIYLFDD
ncbi:outer membrane beta-barrel protein [Prevotella multiformis]|nr:outer membrane beta-barrel protein [Prevotella multiformis]QUB70150.1 outer membrane beta-barrel protein [Prevotella multiformis]